MKAFLFFLGGAKLLTPVLWAPMYSQKHCVIRMLEMEKVSDNFGIAECSSDALSGPRGSMVLPLNMVTSWQNTCRRSSFYISWLPFFVTERSRGVVLMPLF